MNPSEKLPSLEGLRGIAAFVVVITHLRLTFFPSSSVDMLTYLGGSLPYGLARIIVAAIDGMTNGSFAVWIFWIMSAFALSLQYFMRAKHTSLQHAQDYLEDACLRRYPRLLLPVFASVMFAFSLHALGLMYNQQLAGILGNGSWMVAYYKFSPSLSGAVGSAVWQSFFAFEESTTYNSVLWTMEKEFYGSLFLFAFLAIFGQRKSRFILYWVVALVSIIARMQWLDAFVFGIALCDVYISRGGSLFDERNSGPNWLQCLRRSKAGAILLWSLIFIGVGFKNKGGVTYPLIGMVAVTMALSSVPTQRILSSRLAVFLGKISFGLYLIHFPLMCSFSSWAYIEVAPRMSGGGAAVVVSIVTCGASILAGYLLYLGADRPAIKLSRRLAQRLMQRSA